MNNNLLKAIAAILVVSVGVYAGFKYFGSKKCPDNFFEQMGDLPGCNVFSAANDISDDGLKVVGQSSSDDINDPNDCFDPDNRWPIQAAGWTQKKCPFSKPFFPGGSTGLIGLGYLNSNDKSSIAKGISPDGLITVGYSTDMNLKAHASVFLSSGVVELSSTSKDFTCVANDVSDKTSLSISGNWGNNNSSLDRRIIVGYWGTIFNPHQNSGSHAIYWNSGSAPVLLSIPALPNGQDVISSEAICISDDGKMIGGNLYYNTYAEVGTYRSYPCVWKFINGNYVATVLEDLPGGDINARITHISGNGNIAVGWGNTIPGDATCAGYPKFACKWTITEAGSNTWGAPVKLDPLPGQLKYSYASGTNFNGTVIVGSTFDYNGCEWTEGFFSSKATKWNGITASDIAALLGNLVPVGYQLSEAIRVSGNGKIISGISYPANTGGEGWVAGF